MIQLHQLKPNTKRKRKKRIGRGGKRGTYSGRGIKGQKARAGRRIRPAMRDRIKKIPKLRGYRMKVRPQPRVVINIQVLDKYFNDSDVVTPAELLRRGVIRRTHTKTLVIKLLGSGTISKKLVIKDCQVSKGAKEKIEKAGGRIENT